MARIVEKRMPSVMGAQARFSQVPDVALPRSVFDRSHSYKSTFDSGLLVPVFVDYAMPGDTFDVRMTALARLTTPIKPFMDNMYLDSFFFAVPMRLIWTNFPKFMGEQTNPGDSISFTVPQCTGMPATGYVIGSLGDYFGLPTAGTPAVTASISHSALPLRAYHLIYNQWFRDENLINTHAVPMDDGPDTDGEARGNQVPWKRGKRHDYFTSCLPSPQKGTATQTITQQATVKTSASALFTGAQQQMQLLDTTGGAPAGGLALANIGAGLGTSTAVATGNTESLYPSNLYADVSIDINALRLAIATQQFLEKDARGGTRYTELIFSHFGVKSSDARLQRAEYLGGGSTPIMFAPVAQATQAAAPTFKDGLANLGATGGTVATGHGFSKSFEEHCVVIGIVNVRADLTYSQGIERFWSYSTRYDFPWPDFANLGEQAVLNKEIYATGAAADANVFGYQERYAERRYKPSKVTNLFRPTAAGTLELWHLSEKFTALPTLGQTFIEDQTETVLDTRVQVPTEPDWYFDAWFEFKAAMALPVYGVPGLTRL